MFERAAQGSGRQKLRSPARQPQSLCRCLTIRPFSLQGMPSNNDAGLRGCIRLQSRAGFPAQQRVKHADATALLCPRGASAPPGPAVLEGRGVTPLLH